MYLHVGNGKNIRQRDIIAIFDFENSTVENITRRYLAHMQKLDLVETANDELPKSFILYKSSRTGKVKVCFSQLSPASLCGRERL